VELKNDAGAVVATVQVAKGEGSVQNGVWITLSGEKTAPTLCFYQGDDGIVLGLYRNAAQAGNGCDFGLRLTESGVEVQAVKNGELKLVDLFDLLSKF